MTTTKEISAQFDKFNVGCNWWRGTVGEYGFEAKIYNEGSVHGINNGRVSKLAMWKKNKGIVVNYDRGWDIAPKKNIKPYFDAVMESLENAPPITEIQQ